MLCKIISRQMTVSEMRDGQMKPLIPEWKALLVQDVLDRSLLVSDGSIGNHCIFFSLDTHYYHTQLWSSKSKQTVKSAASQDTHKIWLFNQGENQNEFTSVHVFPWLLDGLMT